MFITSAQMFAMQEHTEEKYVQRVADFISEECDPGLDAEELRSECAQLIERARAEGFLTELEVATYVMCGFVFGPEFDKHVELPFCQILQNRELDAETKAYRMQDVLDDEASMTEESGHDD